MTSVANTVAMTTFAVHTVTLQPLIFYRLWAHDKRKSSTTYNKLLQNSKMTSLDSRTVLSSKSQLSS